MEASYKKGVVKLDKVPKDTVLNLMVWDMGGQLLVGWPLGVVEDGQEVRVPTYEEPVTCEFVTRKHKVLASVETG